MQTKINALITNFIPNIFETKTASKDIVFTHPGIGLSKQMLDNMQSHVRVYDEPWASAFVNFSEYGESQKNLKNPPIRIQTWNPDYINIAGGGQGTIGHTIIKNMEQDADTSFKQIIMWYITGEESYRINAIKIIRDWTCVQSIGGVWDEQIRVSLAVYKFCLTADILRYADCQTTAYNWTDKDTSDFEYFLDLMKDKYDRYSHYMNQHSFCVMGTMAAAIFRNDADLYKKAIQRITTNPEMGLNYNFYDPANPHARDGSIISQIRAVTTNVTTGETVPENIQVVEMGRDQPHAYNNIAGLSILAMTAYCQGTNVDPVFGTASNSADSITIFNFLNDRLLKGADYLCKYNLGYRYREQSLDIPSEYQVTFIPCYHEANASWHYEEISESGAGRIDVGIGIIYNYYKYIEQNDIEINARFLHEAYQAIYPEGNSQDFLGNSVLLYSMENTENNENNIFADSITIKKDKELMVNSGGYLPLEANITPNKANEYVRWKVTDIFGNPTTIANISEKGLITANAPGEILVTAHDSVLSNIKDTVTVTILPGIVEDVKLFGSEFFGTATASNQSISTYENAFDEDSETSFESISGGYVGMMFKMPQKLSGIRFLSNSDKSNALIGGCFQGSNATDYTINQYSTLSIPNSQWENIYTIEKEPVNGQWQNIGFNNFSETSKEKTYKFIRFYSNASSTINEIEFYKSNEMVINFDRFK